MPSTHRLSRAEASQYLFEKHQIQLKPATLAKMAVVGGGPEFQIDGRRPLYPIDRLDAYAAKRLSPLVSTTSQLRGSRGRSGESPAAA